MIELGFLILGLGILTGLTLAETKQDYFVILFQDPDMKKAFPKTSNNWKIWGNVQEAGWILFWIVTVGYFLESWTTAFWIPIFWIWRTIFHNGFIALDLGEKFYYLGNTGLDGKIKKIFIGSGAVYLGFLIFVLFILILSYLSLKFGLDIWQLILNIFR